mmetsp:Transcript_25663/g.60174  ORF Transcript_25663/g.60174 Transcript_25663/m.60174 type:complete len:251 (-) Transcript_25663:7-759(-)
MGLHVLAIVLLQQTRRGDDNGVAVQHTIILLLICHRDLLWLVIRVDILAQIWDQSDSLDCCVPSPLETSRELRDVNCVSPFRIHDGDHGGCSIVLQRPVTFGETQRRDRASPVSDARQYFISQDVRDVNASRHRGMLQEGLVEAVGERPVAFLQEQRSRRPAALCTGLCQLCAAFHARSKAKAFASRRARDAHEGGFLVVQVDEGVTEIADSLARVSLSTEAGHHQDAVLACRGVHPSFNRSQAPVAGLG